MSLKLNLYFYGGFFRNQYGTTEQEATGTTGTGTVYERYYFILFISTIELVLIFQCNFSVKEKCLVC